MTIENLILISILIGLINLVFIIVVLLTGRGGGISQGGGDIGDAVDMRFDSIESKLLSSVRDIRAENDRQSRDLLDKSDRINRTLNENLQTLRRENSEQLDRMRMTVDEKLQSTLNTRLTESFEQVQKQLESVYKGLGEMTNLAKSVGDLSKMFSNVKARGVWGEVQAHAILSEILAPGQLVTNFHPHERGQDVVEFAVKLPGKGDGESVYLPIDSKFPREDYSNYLKAQERNDAEGMKYYKSQLKARVQSEAVDIKNKYINPPRTTDFAVLFLPTESLYAEILSFPGFVEELQVKCRVTVAGPTTLSALINSLQMGFRSLAVEKRSHEVWKMFSAMKKQFMYFSEAVAIAEKNLGSATVKLSEVSRRSEAISQKLQGMENPEEASSQEA